MQKTMFRVPTIIAAALAVVGATPTAQAVSIESPDSAYTPQGSELAVVVHNNNSMDVEVVAVTEAGRRFKLGAVQRNTEHTFDLPQGVTDDNSRFRLKVYSIGCGYSSTTVHSRG